MELNDLTYKIRGAIFTVHKELGPGLLERAYESALSYELMELGLKINVQLGMPVFYKGIELDLGYKLDILVENQVIIEIKSVEMLQNVHKKQLLSYLKISNKKLGFLVNFNVETLVDKQSLIRIIN